MGSCASVHQHVHLCICAATCASVKLCINMCIHASPPASVHPMHQHVRPCICAARCISVNLCSNMCICASGHASVHPCINTCICACVHQHVRNLSCTMQSARMSNFVLPQLDMHAGCIVQDRLQHLSSSPLLPLHNASNPHSHIQGYT